MRRVAAVIAVIMLLAGCSKPEPPPSTPSSPEPVIAPETPPSPPPAAEIRPVPAVLAEPGPDALRRVSLANGDVVQSDGFYFLNSTSGTGEAWLFPADSPYWGTAVSDDNRFLTITGDGHGYVVDRKSNLVWRWDPKQVQLLLTSEQGFLFQEAGNGRYIWTGPDFRPRHTFALTATGWARSPLLSPDGRRLALYRGELALIDLESGKVQQVKVPVGDSATAVGLEPFGGQIQLEVWPRWPDRETKVLRYNWAGELTTTMNLPGQYSFFSPDGKWVAWEEWPLGDLGPATVIADTATLKPRVQAFGTTPCFQMAGSGGTRWLADGSGLVVDSNQSYRVLTLDGQLQERKAFAGLIWKNEPQPAPDLNDRFALGRLAVSDGGGAKQLGVTLEGYVTPGSLEPWGASSSELRFVLPPPAKGGACTEMRPPLPTRVLKQGESMPEYPLIVEGSCLDMPGGACLPAGTRLKPARPRDDIPGVDWRDQTWLLYVKTESGRAGWVSLAGGQVKWSR